MSDYAFDATQTVLVVDDDPAVIRFISAILDAEGFTVLEAPTVSRALDICQRYAGPIHLLISDYSMPDMNGRALAICIRTLRPDIRTLYISGYGDSLVLNGAALAYEAGFLQKPFTCETLLERVNDALRLVRQAK